MQTDSRMYSFTQLTYDKGKDYIGCGGFSEVYKAILRVEGEADSRVAAKVVCGGHGYCPMAHRLSNM